MLPSQELIGGLALAAALAAVVGHRIAAASHEARLRKLQHALRRSEQVVQQLGASAVDLEARLANGESRCSRLQRMLVEIPDVAQQLAGTRRAREIPENALDFVEKFFQPRYSVFYRAKRGGLVAVAIRGESGVATGERIVPGEGVVGWVAQTQLPISAEDLRVAGGMGPVVPSAGAPQPGFSLCLPIVSESRCLGVILVGPGEQDLPQQSELGRTLALITSVVTTTIELLTDQSRLAETDGLTGLLNRTRVLAGAKRLLGADPSPRSIAFFLFDVDHFKHYNDSHGHLAGDEILKALSLLLRENTREEELVGRYGGEEFLIVMPNVEREPALRAAERIRARIASTAFPHGEKQPGGCVSVSGGLSVWPVDGNDLETLLKRADAALYAAKRAGRNRLLAYATPELGGEGESGRVARAVATALLEDEFEHAFWSDRDARVPPGEG